MAKLQNIREKRNYRTFPCFLKNIPPHSPACRYVRNRGFSACRYSESKFSKNNDHKKWVRFVYNGMPQDRNPKFEYFYLRTMCVGLEFENENFFMAVNAVASLTIFDCVSWRPRGFQCNCFLNFIRFEFKSLTV